MVTEDIYIGQSTALADRKRRHFHSLDDGKHKNRFFQRSFDKYGYNNFDFKVLLYCESFELTRYEQTLVNIYDPIYNICKECINSRKGVIASIKSVEKMIGHPVSESTRKRISKSLIGNIPWNKSKKGSQIAWNKGLKMPDLSEEHKQKISAGLMGRLVSEETRNKIRLSNTGKIRFKAAWNKGIKTGNLPEETKRKMAISQKIRREKEIAYGAPQ